MKKFYGPLFIVLIIGLFLAIYFSWNTSNGGDIRNSTTEDAKSMYLAGIEVLESLNRGEVTTFNNQRYINISKAYSTESTLTTKLESLYTKEVTEVILERLDVTQKDGNLYVKANAFEEHFNNNLTARINIDEENHKEYELEYMNANNQTELLSLSLKKVGSDEWKVDTVPN